MQGKNIARRRGTSVAAAALSFALVAPFAQPVAAPNSVPAAYAGTPAEAGQLNDAGNGVKYPGENADGVYQSVVDEQRYTFADQPIKVDGAIESKGEKNTTESIEGYVIHQRDGDLSVYPGTRDPWKPIPMEGVRVYAQWTEKGGITSPVYTTTTNADGYYSIKMKPFNNAKGEVVKFDADPNGPQYEKIRVWVDNPDTNNFTQLYGYNFGHMGPNGNTYDTPGGMGWGVGPDRVSNVRFAFGEKTRHDIMHLDKADKNPVVGNGPGQIKGNLFWHLYHTQGAFTPNLMNKMNGADVPATGVKVYGSYLSDYAVNEIKEKAANDLGFDEIRGRGWTNRNETALQNWIKRKMAEEGKEKWIAETAEATVGSDGNYTLQFRGSFGRNTGATNNVDRGYDDKAFIYTDLARDNGAEVTFPDGKKHNAYNLFGQVAPAADVGSWVRSSTGRGIKNIPKHVNWDWLFFSTEKTEGLGQFTPFYNNSFLPRSQYVFNGEGKWAGGMVYGAGEHYLLENRHVFYSDYVVFDVLEYDTRENPAKPGAVVETKTAGLPIQWVDGLQYQIEWVDQETGKVVKKCGVVAADANGTIPSCQLDTGDTTLFPDGIQSTTTFTAYLYPVNKETGARGQAIAADAFTVLVGWQPRYEETPATPGEAATSKAPTFDNTETEDVEKLTAEELKAQDENKEPTKYVLPETFEIPEGYAVSVDEATGEVSVTFPAHAASNDSLDVPVQVTYKDGTNATATAPFVVKSTDRNADQVEPEYTPGSGQPGKEAKVEKPEFKTVDENGEPTETPAGKPERTEFAQDDSKAPTYTDNDGNTKDLPSNSVTVDMNTGEITVKVPEDAEPHTEIKVPVEVTYPDNSVDKVDAIVKVADPDPKDNESYEPAYEGKLVVPGKETKSSPTFTDKEGKDAKAPEDSKFAITESFTAPEGYVVDIDENNGEITVTFPDKSKLSGETAEEFDVPVTVTYPDKSTDEVKANFKLDTDGDGDPDVTDPDDDGDGIPDKDDSNPKVPNANDHFDPKYEDGSGKPGSDVTIDAPKFTDKDGNDTKAPEGTKFTPGDKVPEGVTVNEDGSITVTVPEDAKPGSKIEVPVVVTYPDGTTDEVTVTVTVEQPDAKDADSFEPKYEGKLVVPGEEAKSSPTFTDKEGKDAKAPEDSKFAITEGFTAPEGYVVEIDENNGEITVTFPDKSKLSGETAEEFDVPVTVTYPDKSTDEVKANFKLDTDGDGDPDVTDPDDDGDGIPDKDDNNPKVPNANDHFDPKYEDGSGKPGSDVTIDAPKFTDKDGNDTKAPEGTKFTPGDKVPEGVTVNEDGSITVTVPEDAKPGSKIEVPVVVTYPDGTTDEVTVTVTVEKPDAPAEKPDWNDDKGKPGEKVEIPNTGGEVPEGTTVETEGPGKAEIDENGNLVVDVDKDANPGDKIVVVVKDKDGNEVDRVVVEVEKPDAPAEKPDWNDDKGKPGEKVEIPNTGGEVPEGTTVETEGPGKAEIDENGNLVVDVDKDANPGDKIVVVVKDKDGNEVDRVVVEVEKPAKTPDWNDTSTNPGKPVEVPNTGGPVEDGTTVETTGPGTAELGKDGTITVTPSKNAKPGDKIKVVVKDKDGNTIDEFEVKIGTDVGKCVATTLGFGLPLIALLPIGLATQMDIPGVTPIANEVSSRIEQANSQIQQQLGIFNPQMAGQVAEINARLKEVGGDLSTVAAGIALIAAGILAGTLIYDNCSPNGGFNSSVKDLELKGSSGKTHKLSSKKQGEDKKPSAQK